jgi:hypothetical protein
MLCAMLVFALGFTGCGRMAALNYEKDMEIEGQGTKSFTVTAPNKEQKVNVLVRSNGVPLDVYVALEKDLATLERQVTEQKAVTASCLTKKDKVTEGTLEATVPAGASFGVLLVNPGSKKASAAVKIASSK